MPDIKRQAAADLDGGAFRETGRGIRKAELDWAAVVDFTKGLLAE